MSSGVHNYGRGARQLGFSVHALSKALGPDEICSRIDAFLPQFREILRGMSKEVGMRGDAQRTGECRPNAHHGTCHSSLLLCRIILRLCLP